MRVIQYPSEKAILSQISEPVTRFNKDLVNLVNTMFRTIEVEKGVGLAAIQIGVPKRVLVIHNPESGLRVAMINASWEITNPFKVYAKEGCLSSPGQYVDIERYIGIKVKYVNLQNKPQEKDLNTMDARIFQHEYDHWDGVCLVGKNYISSNDTTA